MTGTPEHLLSLKARGLLQSTGKQDDYAWIEQLQSHRLFVWALQTVAVVVETLIRDQHVPEYFAAALRVSYAIGSPTYSLAGGGQASFTMRYNPTAVGLHQCTISTGMDCESMWVYGTGYVPRAAGPSGFSAQNGGVYPAICYAKG